MQHAVQIVTSQPTKEKKTLQMSPRIERWCFTNDSWKDKEVLCGQGWYSTLEDFDGLMGAKNTRSSLSPLHGNLKLL
ncbi:hypothetical protein Bca101_059511 [Brassica carinata]